MIRRVEQKIATNSLARVNPVVEEQIRVLATGGDLTQTFREIEIKEIGRVGRDAYLADLYRTRQSIAEEGIGGE